MASRYVFLESHQNYFSDKNLTKRVYEKQLCQGYEHFICTLACDSSTSSSLSLYIYITRKINNSTKTNHLFSKITPKIILWCFYVSTFICFRYPVEKIRRLTFEINALELVQRFFEENAEMPFIHLNRFLCILWFLCGSTLEWNKRALVIYFF